MFDRLVSHHKKTLHYKRSSPAPLNLTQHDIRQPYLKQWNVSVDQQLPGSISLTASYVGT